MLRRCSRLGLVFGLSAVFLLFAVSGIAMAAMGGDSSSDGGMSSPDRGASMKSDPAKDAPEGGESMSGEASESMADESEGGPRPAWKTLAGFVGLNALIIGAAAVSRQSHLPSGSLKAGSR